MKPRPFDYVRPDTVEEAVAILAEHGDDARILAGGQTLLAMLNLRVVEPGEIAAGDPITVLSRPAHEVTVALSFRALTTEPELLPRLLDAEAFPAEDRAAIRRRLGRG